MTEAERLLKEPNCPKGQEAEQTGSPAEQFLRKPAAIDCVRAKRNVPESRERSGNIGFKVLAVVVFVALILIGTYFARMSGPAILGYIIGAAAFIIAPKIWNAGEH